LNSQQENELEYALRGKAWKVYWFLLKSGTPQSVREVQRGLHFSSPSVANHHLEQLRDLGLVEKQELGGHYFLVNEVKIGVLRHYVKLGKLLFPRYFFYAVFSTTFYVAFLTVLMQGLNWLARENLFIIIFGVIILSLGLGELSRYILSTIDPNILNELPSTSLFYNQSETPFAPIFNYIEFIVAVIIAPIVEEILFRGVMLHRFTIKWGIKWAIMASSIIFALFHADIIGAFIFAIVMCILYIKTASILVPILAHIINNLLAYGFEIMLSLRPGSTVTSHSLEVAILLLTVSIIIIFYFLYRNWPKRYWRPPYFQEVYDGIPENLYYD